MTALPDIAISIRQPWAWAIHAAKGMTATEVTEFSEFLGDLRLDGVVPSSVKGPHYGSLPRGGIVGVAEITGCVNRSGSPWFFGPWGFTIANARPVGFIPCKGALGFFSWRGGVEKETQDRLI